MVEDFTSMLRKISKGLRRTHKREAMFRKKF
jgi:hypothetical protein